MGMIDNIKTKSKQAAIVTAADYTVKYVQKNPEKNFGTVLKSLSTMDSMFSNQGQLQGFMNWVNDHPGTRQWFINLLSRDPQQVQIFVKNFLGNCALKWIETAEEIEAEHGFCPPYTILISPSMRCNLHCRGCYAANYEHKKSDDLDMETYKDIIRQGKEMGVYFYTILGGEPFVVFDDMIYTAAKENPDCLFQVFTNGSLITPEVADKLKEVGNVVVVFSVNGTREDTTYMRGEGVYDRILESVALLRERNLMYGMSLVLTSQNYDTLTSREFLKFWEDQGVIFGWNFLFMPVGDKPDLSLMPTPEQRIEFGEFIKQYREDHPLFVMDFWADAPALHGCIAAGRRFMHINNKGDIEPCIFAHHATHNIHEHTLMEAMQSPFFTFMRMQQPHTDNFLRPCMIIDNPEIWRTACKRFDARPTDHGAGEMVNNPEIIKHLDEYSAAVAPLADKLYKERYQHKIDDVKARRCSYGEGIDRVEYDLDRVSFLEKIRHWAEKNPEFAKTMLESLEYADTRYGTDEKRHVQLFGENDSVCSCQEDEDCPAAANQ